MNKKYIKHFILIIILIIILLILTNIITEDITKKENNTPIKDNLNEKHGKLPAGPPRQINNKIYKVQSDNINANTLL